MFAFYESKSDKSEDFTTNPIGNNNPVLVTKVFLRVKYLH